MFLITEGIPEVKIFYNLILIITRHLIGKNKYIFWYNLCCLRHDKATIENISINLTLHLRFVRY